MHTAGVNSRAVAGALFPIAGLSMWAMRREYPASFVQTIGEIAIFLVAAAIMLIGVSHLMFAAVAYLQPKARV